MVGRIHIMGIVNLTPDSFYAGSRAGADQALDRIRMQFSEGADVVDLGACSTRPGAPQPSLEEEWSRLEPVLSAIRREEGFPEAKEKADASGNPSSCRMLSIDTYRAGIVSRAYDLIGPFMVNDVGGGEWDPEMLSTVGRLGLPYLAMCPSCATVEEIIAWFQAFSFKAAEAGLRDWILDPGFGFGKDLDQNYAVLRGLDRIVSAFPQEVLAGVSRKSMIYKKLGITPEEAMPATQVVQFAALEKGATWLRVHDVAAAVHTARLYSTIYTSSPGAAK